MAHPMEPPSGSGSGATPTPAAGMPRWVKLSLIVVTLLVALFIGLQLAGVGDHGPGRHFGPGGGTPAGDMRHTPPPGMDHDL
jgi:hypothetical protein